MTMVDLDNIRTFEISNGSLKCKIMNFGAAVLKLEYKGTDVVLAHEHFESYLDNNACLGVTVLPNANRTGGASYSINGQLYNMEANEKGHNNLHSSLTNGAHKRFWDVEEYESDHVVLSLKMSDGDLGFPGNRYFTVTYRIINDSLVIRYTCLSDKDTVFNPTNHSYFNLNGHDVGSILDHTLKIDAECFTPVNEEMITTGELRPVENTPFDFRNEHTIGSLWDDNDPQMKIAWGYDHNFVLNEESEWPVVLKGDKTGIVLKCHTECPGIQVYTGNYLNEQDGKGGHVYGRNEGVALETQFFPNSLNIEEFPKAIVSGGITAETVTVYKFECEKEEV